MKHLLLTTVAAVVLVGCGPSEPPDISIHQAANDGNIAAVKQRLADDVNAKNGEGMTPLHYAAYRDYKEIVELLIAKGADVNAKQVDGMTPLHNAAVRRHKEVAELLIANGADVNAKGGTGDTPLHNAANNAYKDVVELLIAKGADVNAKDDVGKTPLDWAIKFKNTATTDHLRKHGGKTAEELKAEGK